MNWENRLEFSSDLSQGSPVIKGTKFSVQYLLQLFSDGLNVEMIIDRHPKLEKENLLAMLAFLKYCARKVDKQKSKKIQKQKRNGKNETNISSIKRAKAPEQKPNIFDPSPGKNRERLEKEQTNESPQIGNKNSIHRPYSGGLFENS